jgi:hypothetical protein
MVQVTVRVGQHMLQLLEMHINHTKKLYNTSVKDEEHNLIKQHRRVISFIHLYDIFHQMKTLGS